MKKKDKRKIIADICYGGMIGAIVGAVIALIIVALVIEFVGG